MPRALKNLDITLGLAVIPVQLLTATRSQGVAFHLLHARCGSRIQMRLECPTHGIVPREETVSGELSATEFQPENYEDEYRKRLLKAIERKVAGQEIERVEVGGESRPEGTSESAAHQGLQEAVPSKGPTRRRRAS
jgi:non-homologous end joining protein Ku